MSAGFRRVLVGGGGRLLVLAADCGSITAREFKKLPVCGTESENSLNGGVALAGKPFESK